MSGHRHLNLSYLQGLSGGNTEFVNRMLQSFCSNIPTEIERLKAAHESNNAEEIRKAAHKMKSMLRYVGADATANGMEHLEFNNSKLSDHERHELISSLLLNSSELIAEAQQVLAAQ